MANRSYDDQDKEREIVMEERLVENNQGLATLASQNLYKDLSYPLNHQKRNEEEVDRLLATVSHEFKQITLTATEELKKKNNDLYKRLIKSDRERKRYRNELDDLRKQFHIEGTMLRREIEELKQTNKQREKEWAKRLKESDETSDAILKKQLKKADGGKLTESNPNIAELCDKHRPTKIAEMYEELYDNQWTDAFEEIDRHMRTEEDTIRILLEILMDVMRFCKQRAKRQMEKLQSDLTCSENQSDDCVPDNVTKQLKDLRKVLATAAKDNLYLLYISFLKRSTDENHKYAMKIEPFVKECFEVCWFMAIQDPPVVFCSTANSGEPLNTNLYKVYTNIGRYIEFLVWPAMLLHESGPVLAKGIVQGTNVKKELLEDPYTRHKRNLSSREDQRSESAEGTRQSYMQSTVTTMVSVTKPKYERHPTSEEMRRYFYYLDRRDYAGAQNALGYDIYIQCMLNEDRRSQYC